MIYTHRVAISNSRLVALQDGRVSFRYKDYGDENREKTMTLEAPEFMRRFLMHLLPNGFMHIRHYGWLANCVHRKKLALCRTLIGMGAEQSQKTADLAGEHENDAAGAEDKVFRCPVCSAGRMVIVLMISPDPNRLCAPAIPSAGSDTS